MSGFVVMHTLISRFLLILLMIIFAVPILILLLLPKKWGVETKLFYMVEYAFCWLLLKISFIPYRFIGLENIIKTPAIVIANHQSSVDIPVVAYALRGYPHIWLAISTLMSSPILRFILPRIAVLVDMTTPMTGMRSLIEAIKLVNGKQCHVVLFPEGGRYTDGSIHDFFGGYVILAKKMGRPVIPIYIKNLNKVYPPNSFWIYRHPVTVIVGTPMRIEHGEDEDTFNQRVHRWFLEKTMEE